MFILDITLKHLNYNLVIANRKVIVFCKKPEMEL